MLLTVIPVPLCIYIQIQTVKTKHSFEYVAASGLVSMYRDNDFCLPVGRD